MKNEKTLTIYSEVLSRGDLWTWANLVTTIRLIGSLTFFSLALVYHNVTYNLIGLAIYWALDALDGFLARRLNQETRLGAQFDILADRLLITFFYFNFLIMNPELVVVVVLFLFQFMGLDHYLSNQFMRWPILSPNYFYRVDRIIWQLNWSAPGKVLNCGLVTILLIATKAVMPALVVVLALIGVKLYSCIRLHRLPLPQPVKAF